MESRRKRWALYAIAGLLVILAVAINAVNRVQTEVPEPLWTRDALDMPGAEANGFTLIAHYHSTTISGIDLEPIDKVLALARDHQLSELGRVFAPARSVASKITEHAELCGRAFERERMVVPCLEIDEGACSVEPLSICTRLVTFSALDDASRGAPGGVQRMSRVLERLMDAAANSPHPWVQARALALLRGAIHHAAVIIRWRRGDTRPLRAAVERITPETLPLRSLVVASFLLKHEVLRDGLDKTDTWLLDEGSVIRELNAPFEAFAETGELPPPRTYTDGLLWWFENPVGKRMLDAVRPGADDDFVRTTELRDTLFKRREETLRLR